MEYESLVLKQAMTRNHDYQSQEIIEEIWMFDSVNHNGNGDWFQTWTNIKYFNIFGIFIYFLLLTYINLPYNLRNKSFSWLLFLLNSTITVWALFGFFLVLIWVLSFYERKPCPSSTYCVWVTSSLFTPSRWQFLLIFWSCIWDYNK